MTDELSDSGILEVLSFSSLLTGLGFAIMAAIVLSFDQQFARSFTVTATILGTLSTAMYRLAVRDSE